MSAEDYIFEDEVESQERCDMDDSYNLPKELDLSDIEINAVLRKGFEII